MAKNAKFKVDTRLASILGENYRSSEDALKELVDNAWDADAENVWITLPEPMTDSPIIIKDDGYGMTEKEVRNEYLNIARDRISKKGDKTIKGRLVKGRKGIGKFAGLVMASVMTLETKARSQCTSLTICKENLLESKQDIEKVNLPINGVDCDQEEHGTVITLSKLNDKLNFPIPEKFKQRLVLEYGREERFCVYVNGDQLKPQDIPGEQISKEVKFPDIGPVKINFSILEKPVNKLQAGIVIRVNGKIIGQPTFMGLEEDEGIPSKLLRRIAGEIQADGLPEEDITADWGAIISNSKAYEKIKSWASPRIKKELRRVYKNDIERLKTKRKREIEQRLSALPVYRRKYAEAQLEKILQKFYGESQDRIDIVISFVLDAMEKDEYWTVLQEIDKVKDSDIATFAESLQKFGLVDIATMASQAQSRLKLLDYLDALSSNEKTLEAEIHKALEKNLWAFGVKYSTMASNVTTKNIVEKYKAKKFRGNRSKKRPDLLLSQNISEKYLLIEFKKPSDPIGRDAEAQAKKYRDDLTIELGHPIDILIIGGSISSQMSLHYEQQDVQFLTYNAIISNARTELNWLLKELTNKDVNGMRS